MCYDLFCVTVRVVVSCVCWFVLFVCFVSLLVDIVSAGFVLFSLIAVVVTSRQVCCLLLLVCCYAVAWCFVLSGLFGSVARLLYIVVGWVGLRCLLSWVVVWWLVMISLRFGFCLALILCAGIVYYIAHLLWWVVFGVFRMFVVVVGSALIVVYFYVMGCVIYVLAIAL